MAIYKDGFNDVPSAVVSATQKAFMTCKCGELFHVPLEHLEQFVADAISAWVELERPYSNPSLDEALNSGDGVYRP